MDLKQWIDKEGISKNEFARTANVTIGPVDRALDGLPIRIATAEAIHAATGNRVSLVSLLKGSGEK